MRHGRRGILPAVAVLAVACLGAYQVWGQLDGTTVESRETLLAEAMPAGYGWNLVSELELEGYLIGGALDNEGQSWNDTGLNPDIDAALSADEQSAYYDFTIDTDPQINRAVSTAQALAGQG